MGRLSKFEGRMDRAIDNAAGSMFKAPISPAQIIKRAEKEMHREKLVSAGIQHAPTLYNVLVNPSDDANLAGYYPTLAGEVETYLKGKASESGLRMDGNPLVRFIVDEGLRSGKFDVIAENVSGQIIAELRKEEMQRYGIANDQMARRSSRDARDMRDPYPPDPYARDMRDPYPPDPYAQPQDDPYGDPYGAPMNNPYDDPYARDMRDPYAAAPQGAAYAPAPAPYMDAPYDDPYAAPPMDDPYDDPYAAAPSARDPYNDPYAAAPSARDPYNDPYAAAPQGAAMAAGAGAAAAMRDPLSTPSRDELLRVPRTQTFNQRRAQLRNLDDGTTYPLNGARVTLGREKGNDIIIHDANISRNHAEFVIADGMWTLHDLGSTNGSFIGKRSVSRTALHNGDIITIGMARLEFIEG